MPITHLGPATRPIRWGDWVAPSHTLPTPSEIGASSVAHVHTGDGTIDLPDILGGANVKLYGATADGTTDDSAAIQDAADVGGTVVFPPGVYCFKNIEFLSGTTVILEGDVSVVAPAGAVAADCFFKATGTSGAHLNTIKVVGGSFDGGSVMLTAIRYEYVDGATWRDTYCHDFAYTVGAGGLLATHCTDVHAWFCRSDTCNNGITVSYCSRGAIIGCVDRNCMEDGFLVIASDSFAVNSCEVYDYNSYDGAGHAARGAIHIYNSDDCAVTGNLVMDGIDRIVDELPSRGIRFRNADRFTCSGNYVCNSAGYGIAVEEVNSPADSAGWGSITGNTVIGCRQTGIIVLHATCVPCTISGNVIVGRALVGGDTYASDFSGITCKSAQSVIAGNSISDVMGDGINISGIDTTCIGNIIHDVGLSARGSHYGITLVTATNCVLANNVLTAPSTHMVNGIRTYSGASARVTGNVVANSSGAAYRLDGTTIAEQVVQTAHIANASVAYTTGGLDTEAEVIAAVNATNGKINSILAALEANSITLTA